MGALKGNFKWCEDQIAMVKKMLRRNEGDKSKQTGGKNGDDELEKAIKQLQADLHQHVLQTDKAHT